MAFYSAEQVIIETVIQKDVFLLSITSDYNYSDPKGWIFTQQNKLLQTVIQRDGFYLAEQVI